MFVTSRKNRRGISIHQLGCRRLTVAKRVNVRLSFPDPAPMQRGVAARLDLQPFKIADFLGPQPTPEGDKDQRGVTMTVPSQVLTTPSSSAL
jgi:hypothetical protein